MVPSINLIYDFHSWDIFDIQLSITQQTLSIIMHVDYYSQLHRSTDDNRTDIIVFIQQYHVLNNEN